MMASKNGNQTASPLSSLLEQSSASQSSSNVKSMEKGEIYIRADGKKVRRVKKTVVRPKGGGDSVASAPVLSTASTSPALGEVYINKDGKKVRRVSRAVSSSNPPPASAASSINGTTQNGNQLGTLLEKNGSNNNNNSLQKEMGAAASVSDGTIATTTSEVYIRADGKKVRRIKRTVSRPPQTAAAAAAAADETMGSAETTASTDPMGEVYINKDGKKVRRVRRTVSKSDSERSGDGSTTNAEEPRTRMVPKISASVASLDSTDSNSVVASSSSSAVAATNKNNTIGTFLQNNNTPSKSTGAATVDGSTPSRNPKQLHKAQTIAEGEIYIRADGKKVRRVKRVSSSLAGGGASNTTGGAGGGSNLVPTTTSPTQTKSLQGFLTDHTPPHTHVSGSATVAGDRVVDRIDGGEIYINQDGKKVRRVRKLRATLPDHGTPAAATAAAAETATDVSPKPTMTPAKPPTASSDLNTLLSQAPPTNKKTGSASVVEGEIYINKDGKKVRRVRRNAPSSSSSVTGSVVVDSEIYIRADGKKVRRVRRSTSAAVAAAPTTTTTPANTASTATPSLGGFLGNDATAKPKVTGAATVVGVPKLDGEIIIRPDGKKVIRRPKKQGTVASLSGTSGAADDSQVYRRADGKLVRRVKRSTSAAGASIRAAPSLNKPAAIIPVTPASMPENNKPHEPAASATPSRTAAATSSSTTTRSTIVLTPEECAMAAEFSKMLRMGLPDDAVRHRMNVSGAPPKIVAAVLGLEWNEEEEGPPAKSTAGSPAFHIKLTPDEETKAVEYQQMLNLGLPEGAVRHKMNASGVHPKIIAAVFGEPWSEPTPAAPAFNNISLTVEEEGTVHDFQKLLKKGLPEGAVRHKMAASGASPKVMAAVFGEPWSEPTPVAAPARPASSSSIPLTSDEAATVQEFQNMLKRGLPEGAIRHKMATLGTHPKIVAAVFGEPWSDPSAKASSGSGAGGTVQLTDEEETEAAQYRKLQKMGLPPDAVRHKMVISGVQPKIMAAVLGEEYRDESSPLVAAPAPAALTTEEEAVAAQYRKMQKMGLPDDAVRHKMIINEVDPKIIAAVFGEDGHVAMVSKNTDAVAYRVVVGVEQGIPLQPPALQSITALLPDEKFAVKVADFENPDSLHHETRYLTLAELSQMSGHSKAELENIVTDKRHRGASPPRFTLQPISEPKYAVSVPIEGASELSPPAKLAGAGMKEVRDGQEVVDSGLAKTARMVSALGNTDMETLLKKLEAGDTKELLLKLQEAEKRQKKLEKQLAQSGIAIAEDIEYMEAKNKVEQIAKRMNEIGGSDVTVGDKAEQAKLREEYFKLEQEMERYNTALMLTEEFQAEQDRMERKWEQDNEAANVEALKKIRRHMPVNIRHLSEADLTTTPSPNGKYLPTAIAKKFKRTNILQCLRLNPDDLERMHPSTLENMRVTGLTLTERRALYVHFKPLGPKWEKNKAEKMSERKWVWYQMMKNNFKENLAPYQRHVDQYGPPENHPYATRENPNVGCPLIGKQCPIKADKLIDYGGDYGWTEEAVYEVSEVRRADVDDTGARAQAEAIELVKAKKANERADLLKKHYKGKLLQVSKANGSCESMDEAMDSMENNIIKWIEFTAEKGEDASEVEKKKELANFTDALNEFKLKVLDFAERSGMQMSGAKKAGGDKPDIRSVVEASLSEEIYECSQVFFEFIKKRMKEIAIHDTRSIKTIEMLEGILTELHERNLALINKLGAKRMARSRRLKSNADLKKEVEDKSKPKEEEAPREAPPMGGGRGGLLDEIGGRGRGGGGRGGLLDAIAGRGRGGGRDAGGGGRGGLLDAIAARGSKPAGGGGRGGLLDAIAARGRGRGGGDGGGRGGLMAALAARGRGGD